jgi:hypothetical protein
MMVSHKTNNRRKNTHQRTRTLVRRIIDAFIRGRETEDTAAVRMQEADKRGRK